MRKYISVFLIIIMCISVFAACKGQNQDNSSNNSSSSATDDTQSIIDGWTNTSIVVGSDDENINSDSKDKNDITPPSDVVEIPSSVTSSTTGSTSSVNSSSNSSSQSASSNASSNNSSNTSSNTSSENLPNPTGFPIEIDGVKINSISYEKLDGQINATVSITNNTGKNTDIGSACFYKIYSSESAYLGSGYISLGKMSKGETFEKTISLPSNASKIGFTFADIIEQAVSSNSSSSSGNASKPNSSNDDGWGPWV